ncbi:hypothetical protein PVT71_24310 (plasmid) [Salipiger sp. H15]|uniref:Uncharacterized protein n=1 Tax=Alloyangia sp. H15 TaxID=3029062 RepID=A0AAU8AQN1_9RHOB
MDEILVSEVNVPWEIMAPVTCRALNSRAAPKRHTLKRILEKALISRPENAPETLGKKPSTGARQKQFLIYPSVKRGLDCGRAAQPMGRSP